MTLRSFARGLDARSNGVVRTDYPLAGLTTYRLGGPAAVYFEPSDRADLAHLVDAWREGDDPPILVLGRGSNLVISDEGFPGVVVHPGVAFSWIKPAGPGHGVSMTAGSSTPLPLLANWAARRGLAGAEFAIAIPGSVGGAVRMNAGAHGGEIADVLRWVTVLDLSLGAETQFTTSELGLAYRRSSLRDDQIVLEATFELDAGDEGAVRTRMELYRKHRATTQPPAVQNAGSTFKNPPGDAAGRLVEAAGLKGFSVGGVRVSELHANFFVADEGATAQDVFDLVHEVRRQVEERMGVDLEPEVRFVGAFRRRAT